MLFGRVLNSDGYRKQKDGTGWVNKLVEFCSQFYLLIHSHRKRKDSVEIRTVLLTFLLEIEISRVAVQRIHQHSNTWWLCEELLIENDFEAIWATFCCHDCGANASEAIQRIATDQKYYHKCSLYVIVY